MAENRRQAVYDLGQNLVDKIKNFDQYLPDAGKVDEMVQKLPDIPLKDIVSPLEKAKAAVEKRLTPDAEKAHTVFANLIDRISAHAKDGISRRPGSRTQAEYDAVIGDAFGQERRTGSSTPSREFGTRLRRRSKARRRNQESPNTRRQ